MKTQKESVLQRQTRSQTKISYLPMPFKILSQAKID